MSHETPSRKRSGIVRLALASTLALGAFGSLPASAQVPGRFYWKTLSGANAVPLIFNSISGNTNPFDPAHLVVPGATVDGTLALVGYARTFTLFDRAAMAAVLLPMGRLSGEITNADRKASSSARGFGDPTLELNVNLIGPKAQKNLVDVVRYEPGFSLDVIADLAVPIGEYDASQPLNLGQNRWYGRVGFPVVWQLGPWVPGRRTTLEFLPAVWLFGPNDDYVGRKLETDPLFQIDAHVTHDFTEHFWGSLDGVWYTGGAASIDGVQGEKLNNLGAGLTLGYQINDNLGVTFGYKSTFNDKAPGDLQMDGFMVSVVYGWHSIVEGARRLASE
ncbi:MAG TPA: transporter [Thermoanaerobaculia bacterium]|nr:transporter [Thermoanaerobaculia bacterium]